MGELAIISLGSNIEPETYLPMAVTHLRPFGAQAVSQVYQNPALGGPPQPDFLNAAVRLETALDASTLRHALRQVEAALGRVRSSDRYAPRTLDLDLLLLGDQIVNGPEVWLPDRGLLERAHLAIPAAEVAPQAIYPGTGETLRAIAKRLLPAAELMLRPEVSRRLRAALLQERMP